MADRRRRRQVRSNEEVLSEGESQQCDAVLLSVSVSANNSKFNNEMYDSI